MISSHRAVPGTQPGDPATAAEAFVAIEGAGGQSDGGTAAPRTSPCGERPLPGRRARWHDLCPRLERSPRRGSTGIAALLRPPLATVSQLCLYTDRYSHILTCMHTTEQVRSLTPAARMILDTAGRLFYERGIA